MYKYHTTKDGENILIGAMRDTHLYNTIKLMCDQIQEQILIITGEYESDADPFMAAMLPQANVEAQRNQARNRLNHLINALPNYVMEATLREFDIAQLLQETFGRKRKLTARQINNKPLLLDGDVE